MPVLKIVDSSIVSSIVEVSVFVDKGVLPKCCKGCFFYGLKGVIGIAQRLFFQAPGFHQGQEEGVTGQS